DSLGWAGEPSLADPGRRMAAVDPKSELVYCLLPCDSGGRPPLTRTRKAQSLQALERFRVVRDGKASFSSYRICHRRGPGRLLQVSALVFLPVRSYRTES